MRERQKLLSVASLTRTKTKLKDSSYTILIKMEWANYLAKGVETPVFHMCDAKEFADATVNGGFYYSPTFKDDHFIHATAEPRYLLEAGNHFYKV